MNGQGPGGSLISRAWAWLLGCFVFVVLLQVLADMAMDLLPLLVLVGLVAGGVWWWRFTRSW